MEIQANYIKRIEIHGLWHRYDIAWDLRPDVNILSGINGVGKTTILNRSVNYLEQTSGEVKSDEKNEKTTYVTVKGLQQAQEDVARYSKEAIRILDEIPYENEFLRELILNLIHRSA